MSKANRQSITMLSVISSAFHFIHDRRMFARVDIHELCGTVPKMVVEIIKNWEVDNSPLDWSEAEKIMAKWESITGNPGDELAAATYVYIASRILVDLQGKIVNPYKRSLLARLDEPIRIMEVFTDPEGRNFPAYELGDKLLDVLYELIDWRWD